MKLFFIFILLNTLLLQADLLLYYIAGVLPAAIINSKPIAKIDNSEETVNQEIYTGQTPSAIAGASSKFGIVYCRWTDPDGGIMIENIISPPVKNIDEYDCPFDSYSLNETGNFIYKLTVEDSFGNEDSNELNVTVIESSNDTGK